MEISQTVRKIISAQTGVPEQELSADTYFRELPQIDSMRILQVILETENAFDVEIPDEATFRIQTIGEFENLVDGLCRQETLSA